MDLPHHLPALLAVHVVPFTLSRTGACFLAFLGSFLSLGFHTNLPTVEFNLARPGRRHLHSLPSGVAPFLFQGQGPPPSIQSPTPEPCLTSGRNAPERTRP